MLTALVLDDDTASRTALAGLVEIEGFTITTAGSLAEARLTLAAGPPDVALVDLTLPDGDGLEIVKELADHVGTDVVLITGNASVDSAVKALRLGAADYLTKPVDVPRLRAILANVARTRELKSEVSALRNELLELGRFGPLIGSSPAMQKVYELIRRAAPTDVGVLITGESGTGKELVASALHGLSRRRGAKFVAVNAGAIAPSLIESELFGHEKGSFTGAVRQRRGLFEQAAGGTLFLDEITEMHVDLQVKLLRVLETGKISRLGSEQPLGVDVRLLAATNRDPDEAVAEGKLRQDLLYRLNVFRISLPLLRERDLDVELLAEHFLAQLNHQEGTRKSFTRTALVRLASYAWPGNVRELRNVVQRCFILADEELGSECLPAEIGGEVVVDSGPHLFLRVGTPLADVERRLILATLDRCGGDKKEAAKQLGISLKTLYNRVNGYRAQAIVAPPSGAQVD